MRKVESRQRGPPTKRRNWTRYWRRIIGLTWWLNVWKRKKNNNIMDIHFRLKNENESHLIILLFFFLFHTFSHQLNQPYNAPPIPRPVSLFCRWSLLTGFHFPHVQCIESLWHFSRWHFNPWTVCFPGLLLPSESKFSTPSFTGVCVA